MRHLIFAFCVLAIGCEDDQSRSTGTVDPGPRAEVESCDGTDNDNDGRIDEGLLRRSCNTACGSGTEVCNNGEFVNCNAPAPEAEICDGIDNDCDGKLDERLSRDCSSDCGPGMESCNLGTWGQCSAPAPRVEDCDGVDNDCDTQVDEDLIRTCNADCMIGYQACFDGAWGVCEGQGSQMEICPANGLDDDCDDIVDEGCDCSEEGLQADCSTDIGVCRRGTKTCDDVGQWGNCVTSDGRRATEPEEYEEICDGLDNDCNSVIDDIESDQPCGSSNVGGCQLGTLVCQGGLPVCTNEVAAISETCDNIDNDCDGKTDEGLSIDTFELNDDCSDGENLNTIPQDTRQDRVVSGANIYPSGDVDWYGIDVEEETNWFLCSVSDYGAHFRVTVTLDEVPEGQVYELCGFATPTRRAPSIRAACEELDDSDRTETICKRSDQGPTTFVLEVFDFCAINDDPLIIMSVKSVTEAFSCEPYSLRIKSETI
jgi:hypothetical protein